MFFERFYNFKVILFYKNFKIINLLLTKRILILYSHDYTSATNDHT